MRLDAELRQVLHSLASGPEHWVTTSRSDGPDILTDGVAWRDTTRSAKQSATSGDPEELGTVTVVVRLVEGGRGKHERYRVG